MTISLSPPPPPLQIPPSLASDKLTGAFFNGLLNTIYQLWTAVYGIRFKAQVKTTNSTVTAIARVKVATGKTVMMQAHIVARRTGGSAGATGDSAFYVLTGAYKNIAGVLTGIGSPSLIAGEDQAGWNVGFTSSSLDAVITVQGAANNEITWESTVSVYEVGA